MNKLKRKQPVLRLKSEPGILELDFEINLGPTERRERFRLAAWSILGVVLLIVANQLVPSGHQLFGLPLTPGAWFAALLGFCGVWLVPGIWISAFLARTGGGYPAWLGTRIAVTLMWYVSVGPVIHFLGRGAKVTTNGVLIATVAATAAVVVGVLIGVVTPRSSTSAWVRCLVPILVGGLGAQLAILVWMAMQPRGMNYEHIQRLDWLIALCSALAVTAGAFIAPRAPRMTKKDDTTIVAILVTVALTCVVSAIAGRIWSPVQQTPSAFSIEHAGGEPPDDLVFAISAVGPDGADVIRRSSFAVANSDGMQVNATTKIAFAGSDQNRATLYVSLPDETRAALCEPGTRTRPMTLPKVTVEDRVSGTRAQARLPEGWCRG